MKSNIIGCTMKIGEIKSKISVWKYHTFFKNENGNNNQNMLSTLFQILFLKM